MKTIKYKKNNKNICSKNTKGKQFESAQKKSILQPKQFEYEIYTENENENTRIVEQEEYPGLRKKPKKHN